MARITENRINTIDINRCVVYRIGREELSSNIVTLTGTGDNLGIIRFDIRDTQQTVWNDFISFWKKNNNLIILGLNVKNINPSGQNKGYYWCPVLRSGNPLRADDYTRYLEFNIQRNDGGIFNDNTNTIYEFYFVNLTR